MLTLGIVRGVFYSLIRRPTRTILIHPVDRVRLPRIEWSTRGLLRDSHEIPPNPPTLRPAPSRNNESSCISQINLTLLHRGTYPLHIEVHQSLNPVLDHIKVSPPSHLHHLRTHSRPCHQVTLSDSNNPMQLHHPIQDSIHVNRGTLDNKDMVSLSSRDHRLVHKDKDSLSTRGL